jgi:hypothetical protein
VIEKKLTVDLHASGQCYVSVLDNLIITHNVSQKVSMVFDINARHPKETHISFPVAAPLPLAPVKLDTKSANDTIEICTLSPHDKQPFGIVPNDHIFV